MSSSSSPKLHSTWLISPVVQLWCGQRASPLLPSAGAESTTEPKQTCNMRLWKNILEQRQDIFQLKIRKFSSFFSSGASGEAASEANLNFFFHQASTKLVNFAKIEFCTEKWTNFHEFFHLLSFEVFSGTYWGTLYVFTSAKKKKKWFAAIVTFWQIYF